MSMPMRLLDTGLMSARRNIAITSALAELHRTGQAPDTLRICMYPPSVLTGCHQRPVDVVRVKACRRHRVEIARRITGGGAVYMSPGVLAWDVVAESYRFGSRPGEVSGRICSGIAAGLARFGLPARFQPLNDVEIEGRRVSESRTWISGPTVVSQGTVLVDVDFAEMAAVLRKPRAAGGHDAGAALAGRITTLSEWLGRVPPMAELKGLLIAGLSHSWRRELRPGSLTPAERQLADRLLELGIGTEAFAGAPAAGAAAEEPHAGPPAARRPRVP
jgi:lipoate-protein ligase A